MNGVRHSRPRTAPLTGRRILVVDDNRDAADSLAIFLKILGADVRTAYDGPSALDLLPAFEPAAILLDIGMPGMNGFEVAGQVRQHPLGTAVRLIAMTGWSQDEDRRRTAEAGFDQHLVKPVDPLILQGLLAASQSPPEPAAASQA
jgi:CheY-like chemotaxis protein